MRVIDLLNKIANGEMPKKIKYKNDIYMEYDHLYLKTDKTRFLTHFSISNLNDYVEIIEEDKKIEKLVAYALDKNGDLKINWALSDCILKDKINEIIDEINSMKEEK